MPSGTDRAGVRERLQRAFHAAGRQEGEPGSVVQSRWAAGLEGFGGPWVGLGGKAAAAPDLGRLAEAASRPTRGVVSRSGAQKGVSDLRFPASRGNGIRFWHKADLKTFVAASPFKARKQTS